MASGQMTGRTITNLSLAPLGKINLQKMPQERRAALATELRYDIAPAMRQRLAVQRNLQTDLHVHSFTNRGSFGTRDIFARAAESGVGTLVLTNRNQARNLSADMRQAADFGLDYTFGALMLSFFVKKGLEIQTKVYYSPYDRKIAALAADHRQHNNDIMSGAAIEGTLKKFSDRGCWLVLAYPGKLLSQGVDPSSFLSTLKALSKSELLHGLETHHSGHTLWQRDFFMKAASKAGLWQDGGSDYPGSHVEDFVRLGTGMWNVDVPFWVVEKIRSFLTAPLLVKADEYSRNGQDTKAFHELWKVLMINPYDFDAYKKAARMLEKE